MKAYEATFEAVSTIGKEKETVVKTETVGGNSLRHAAMKAENYGEENGLGELIEVKRTPKVIL